VAIGGELIGAAYIKVHADSSAVAGEIRRDVSKAASEAGDDAGTKFGQGFSKSQQRELRKTVNSTRQALRFAGPTFTREGDNSGGMWARAFYKGAHREPSTIGLLGQKIGNTLRTSLNREGNMLTNTLRNAFAKIKSPFTPNQFTPGASRAGGNAGTAGGNSFAKGFGNALKNALGPNVNLPFTRAKIPLAALLSAIDPVVQALGSLGGAALSLVGPLASAASVAAAAAPLFASLGIAGVTTMTAFNGMGAALKTQTVLWEKMSKGIKPTTEDLKNAEEAMKGLTPSAQAFVKSLTGIFPELTKIQQTVQENVFRNLGSQFTELAKVGLPAVSKGMADTSNSINAVASSWMTMFKQVTAQGTLASIFEGAQPIITDLGSALGVLIRGVMEFTQAAIPLAQALTGEFSAWATALGQDITAGLRSGEIQAFLAQAKADFDVVLDIVQNLGGALKTTFSIGATTGRGFLQQLASVTQKWDEWTKSAEGNQAITQFFDNSKRAMDAFMPVVEELGKALGGMFNNPAAQQGFISLSKGLADILPIAGQLFQAISKLGIVDIVGQAFSALGQALAPVMPVLTQLAISIGSVLQGAFTAIAPLLPVLGEGLVALGLAITPLVDALGGALTPILMAVVQAIIPLIPIITQLAQIIASILTPAVQALTPALIALAPLFAWIFSESGPVGAILKMVADTMTRVLVPAIQAVIGWIGSAIGWLSNWEAALSQLQAAASAVFAAISATVANWAGNVQGWLNTVVGWFNSFGSRIADAVRGVGDAIAKPFLSAYDKVEGFINRVVGLFSGFGSRILASVSSMGGQILEKLLGGLPGPVRSALGFARGGVVLGPVTAKIGESGAEAIVPLSRPLSQVDPSVRLLSAIAQGKMAGFAAGGLVSGGGRQITVAPGAIVVNTQVENPRRVAEAVLDRMTLALV